jgi:hypothetical protein
VLAAAQGQGAVTMTKLYNVVAKRFPDAMFPPLFAVWRPTLDRWHFLRTARDAETGAITGFKTVWGGWTMIRQHKTTGRAATGGGTVSVRGKPLTYLMVGHHFVVWELADRDLAMRRIPVLALSCWRGLPRPCV